MGNVLDCIGKLKKPESTIIKKPILLSPQESIVNPMDKSISSVLSINPSVNTNVKNAFNWSRIQSIYLGFSSSLDCDLNLSLPMVKTVEKLFDVLEENLLCNSKKIYYSVTYLGKMYMQKFEECTHLSSNDFHISSRSDRMIAHIISIIKLHRLLLNAFETDVKEAQEVLDLIALSHLVMNVTTSDFRLLDIGLEKFLLQFKVVDYETLKIVVAYFSLITNYICNYIDKNKNHSLVNELLSTDTEDTNKRRENLRQLRKWRRLVDKLRYETSTYIEELIRNSLEDPIPLEESKSFKFKTQCPLVNIRDMYPNKPF